MSDDVTTVWPRRVRVPGDPNFSMAGCTEYARGLGRRDGFYLRSEKIAVDGTRESFSQRRDREAVHALRLQWGAESFETVVFAYAEEIRQNLEDENRITTERRSRELRISQPTVLA